MTLQRGPLQLQVSCLDCRRVATFPAETLEAAANAAANAGWRYILMGTDSWKCPECAAEPVIQPHRRIFARFASIFGLAL